MFRIFLLFILVYLVIRWFNRMMYSSNDSAGDHESRQSQKSAKEGKVTVDKSNKAGKIISKNVGEYVDYEEVK